MQHVVIDFKHCYGIKTLKWDFDFSKKPAYAIYAPNGVMKSSLAQTFLDASRKQASRDRIFPNHKTSRSIADEKGKEVDGERVLVVVPYDEALGPGEQTSVLLVNKKLREEHAKLFTDINATKDELLNAMQAQAKSEANFEQEIASTFTSGDDIYTALGRIKDEVRRQKEAVFKDVEYDKIFNEKVVTALATKGLKDAVENYIRIYNDLLEKSTFFKKGTFDYYNAGQIADSLAKNGFFEANHTVNLKSLGKQVEINTQAELEALITEEKQKILTDAKLLKSFNDVAKQLARNSELREFCRYLQKEPALLSRMSNPNKFKEDVIKSYLKVHESLCMSLIEKYENALKRKEEIEDQARRERTQWDKVIAMFNSRFVVPFELEAKNRIGVMMGGAAPVLAFTYKDGDERAAVEKMKLLEALSNGEKKALYILNVLFEVVTRKQQGIETLVVVDDLADSFDYQNKYAIIQYLKEISADGLFKLIIMTHNFDFFRTICGRFVGYSHCLMASKNSKGTTLAQASGINNVFANDWKKGFFKDPKKKIASIAFLRNLVEMTKGEENPDYLKLTSLLHWKSDTEKITVAELDEIYNRLCDEKEASKEGKRPVYELIDEQGAACSKEAAGMQLENKIVLAIAIRLQAERYMIKKIADEKFVSGITSEQTGRLRGEFEKRFPGEEAAIAVLDRVSVMTPENIHLNSFMYEPLIDMSDDHLRKLYMDVKALA